MRVHRFIFNLTDKEGVCSEDEFNRSYNVLGVLVDFYVSRICWPNNLVEKGD